MSAAIERKPFAVTHARQAEDNESTACGATTGAASLDWREVNCKDSRCAMARGTLVRCKPATHFADAWPGVYIVLAPMEETNGDPRLDRWAGAVAAATGQDYVPVNFKLIRADKVVRGELPDASDYDVILHKQRLERLDALHDEEQ